MTKHFVLLYRPGPNWVKGKPVSDQPLKDHLDYMLTRNSEGIVTMVGPFEDSSGGLGIVEAADIEEAQELVDWDPAIRQGTLTADVFEWRRII